MEISISILLLILVIGLIAMLDCALCCCKHSELHKEINNIDRKIVILCRF